MEKIDTKDWLAAAFLMLPIVASLAFVSYKLALEVWCMVYGLIYQSKGD